MTIYILKLYPTPHKWEADACIVGYFTSKIALFKAIRQFKKAWNIYDYAGFELALERGDFVDAMNSCTEQGAVEVIHANEHLFKLEDFGDE